MHAIQEAAASDWPAIERLYREAVAGAAWLPQEARLRANFAAVSSGEVVYVAKDRASEPADFVSVYAPESFIHHLFVAPQFQRHGLGSLLLSSLHHWLPLPWRLKCVRANTSALAFYAAKGWQEVAVGEGEDGQYVVLEFNQEPNPSARTSPASQALK